MEKITSTDALKTAIQLLEYEQTIKADLLKEQLRAAFERLKPINLIKNTLYEVASSSHLVDSIIGTAVGLASGYVSKKIVIGSSGNLLRKLFGSVMQLGVTNVVTTHPDSIKSLGQYIFHHFLQKKVKKLPQNNF